LVEDAQAALKNQSKVTGEYVVNNLNRSIGAMLSNEISKVYDGEGLPAETISYKFRGTAGQSFGAFSTKGIKFELEGDANDYFGKGLCGAELVVFPDRKATFKPSENMAVGNVSFYGATSGEAYINGMAGERFCVRNSGAKVVVEGIGDHGCEYMTGGVVVVLGETGKNFAAGMSGGLAFIYDTKGDFDSKCNTEMVNLEELESFDYDLLRDMIGKQYANTNSEVAKFILDNWETEIAKFVKVYPTDYKRILMQRMAESVAA
jgi:glutamate synthase (NADPH/NADH) large chain